LDALLNIQGDLRMNSKVLILVAASVLFVGCSKDDNKKSDGGFEIQQDFKPTSVPENAMSEADLTDLMQSTKLINQLVPGDNAIMRTTVASGRIENVSSEKKTTALSLLSSQGRQVLNDIKAHCQIHEAEGTEFPNKVRVREMQNSEVKSTVSGDLKKCPLNITSSSQSQRYYTSFERKGNSAAASYEQTFGVAQTMRVGPRLAEMSGLRAMTWNLAMKANVASSLASRVFHAHFKLRGNYTQDYASGERLSGPMQMEAAYVNNVLIQQMLLDLKSSRGALRIVLILNGKEKKAYVNGKAVSYKFASEAFIPGGMDIGN
jgi:hypothetical protein